MKASVNSGLVARLQLSTIACMALSGAALAVSTQEVKSPVAPNIILILADDLGYGDVGCYGATKIKTPNIDRLAANGMRFTDAHTPSAVCSPTRYGLLTGRYCWRTPLQRGPLPRTAHLWFKKDRLTLPAMLKQRGYRTGAVGKWHLGIGEPRQDFGYKDTIEWNGVLQGTPLDMGFHYFYGTPGGHNMAPLVNIENRRVVGQKKGDVVDSASPKNYHDYWGLHKDISYTPYQPQQLTTDHCEKAVSFIENNKDHPFFLYLPLCNVHLPHIPHQRFVGSSEAGVYGDYVQEMDWVVGQLLQTLRKHQLLDNTLLIFTSDNGATRNPSLAFGHKANGKLRGQKGDIWEAGHRVPFVASWPARIKAGTVSHQTICLTDIMPTCASIIGAKLAETSAEDGYDVLPALLGQAGDTPIRPDIIHHSAYGVFAIRKGPWKLIKSAGSGGLIKEERLYQPAAGDPAEQLYNLHDDPAEQHNVYDKYPELVSELSALLEQYRRGDSTRADNLLQQQPLERTP